MSTDSETISAPSVLCVDDEQHVLRALERMLRQFGCRVLLATNADEALDLLKTNRIEVMICDEAMPGMRGVDMLREAKLISPHTTRILLTGHCSDEDVVIPAVNEGEIFRLLSKPWEDNEVRKIVSDALGLVPNEWSQQQERVVQRLQGRN